MKKGQLTKRQEAIERFALSLRASLPKSEQWFFSLYDHFQLKDDESNAVFKKFIPDVLNKRLKYIIEIDGSVHMRADVKAKDELKDLYYRTRGYEVFRVKAYDLESFKNTMVKLTRYRDSQDLINRKLEAEKQRIKTIIRR